MTTNHDIIRPLAGAVAAFCLISVYFQPLPAHAESAVSVLCYHAFLNKKKMDLWTFTVEELSEHIQQLKSAGFTFVSVWDIVNNRVKGTRNILITVDDGNRSVLEAYEKVFAPNGIRPLLAIYPNVIGKRNYALTWEQLKHLADAGCDIAAHGYCHERLTEKTFRERPTVFKSEIFLSKKVLEEKLGRKIYFFVYPFGQRSEPALAMVREAGYRYAFTVDRGRINLPVGGSAAALELPRYLVDRKGWNYCFASCVKNAHAGVQSPHFSERSHSAQAKHVKMDNHPASDASSRTAVEKRNTAAREIEQRAVMPSMPMDKHTAVATAKKKTGHRKKKITLQTAHHSNGEKGAARLNGKGWGKTGLRSPQKKNVPISGAIEKIQL